jgi:hypothetical protein
LRIRDLADDSEYQESTQSKSTILDQIKRGNTSASESEKSDDPSQGSTVGKIKAETDSTMLRSFLNNLSTDE